MKRFAILTVFVAVAFVPLSADIAITVGSRQAALVVKDTRFEPGLQLASEVRAGVGGSLYVGPGVQIQIDGGASAGTTSTSAILDGVVYRALVTRSAWLSGAWIARSGFGAGLAVRAILASYELSTLVAVHAELEVAPVYLFRIAPLFSVRWSIPVTWQLRRDLAYGIGLGVRADLRLEISPP